MKLFLLILFTFLTFSPRAEILKFDITGYKRKVFSYKEVCKEMGVKHLLLVDVINPIELDCMGKKVSIKDFCLKKVKKDKFLRGYVNSKFKEVKCEMGDEAVLSLACNKEDRAFCKDPEKGCKKLLKAYAHSHTLNHYSYIEKDVDEVLNCFYSHPDNLKQVKLEKEYRPYKEEELVIDKDLFKFDKVQNRPLDSLKSK